MTRDTDDLPEIFEDQRDEYDDAATIVAAAMSTATDDVATSDARSLVARAQLQTPFVIDERTHDLATAATETTIRRERRH